MSNPTSEYTFPIFISSTVYNLVDLRAELANYLNELGYKPYLSDVEGFHDSTPDMQPWESCLRVLDTAFVMLLIIDGKYGKRFKWPNSHIIGEIEISPTHAEYLYAHRKGKRILVFIRQEILAQYQSYTTAFKNAEKTLTEKGGKKEDIGFYKEQISLTKQYLSFSLPKQIDFDTLEFIHQVKTTSPIPWIKEFKNVTDIKSEIQKKMMNELAEIFLIKTAHVESVFIALSKILDELPKDKRLEKLKEFGLDRDYIDEIEAKNQEHQKEKDKVKKLTQELADAKKKAKIVTTEKTSSDTNIIGNDIWKLSNEIAKSKIRLEKNEIESANLLYLGTGSALYQSGNNQLTSSLYLGSKPAPSSRITTSTSPYVTSGTSSFDMYSKQCEKCKKTGQPHIYYAKGFTQRCPKCQRDLCSECYGNYVVSTTLLPPYPCEECRTKQL
ncbi:MAG: DUF4062 domain-containing protein [Chitinophagales bacterium]|nr:DUF4062 domain-containing protein [Chitinophagales bacterium]